MSSPTFCCAKADWEAPAARDEPSTSGVDGSLGDSSLGLQLSRLNLDGASTSTPTRWSEGAFGKRVDKDKLTLELKQRKDSADPEFWDDIGVVEFIDKRLGTPDDSTPEQRCDDLREVLAETDILEAHGDVSDFLFHVARTKHGKVYIRVIRTMLLNRGIHLYL